MMTHHLPPEDPIARVLYIDLTRLRFWVVERADLFDGAMGGTGVAIRLLEEECPANTDPLSPENPIILAVGPLVGLYPLASKTVAMFKSPHSGNLGESHAGGRSAVALRMAGFGALVIRGKSELPVTIDIDGKQVRFQDASALWGMHNSYAVGSVLRQNSRGHGIRSIMRIGRAGERQISYASVTTETYRHFGRLGLGAVFGSKNLKALIISGKRSLEVADKKAYRTVYDEIYQSATESDVMKKYHQLGTAVNVTPLNVIGALPTRNVQSGRFEEAEAISGETLAANYLGRRVACAHCPVACIHLAALRIPYPHDPYFYKTAMIGYDHELIFAVGSMLGIGDTVGMLRVIDETEVVGLDVISTGVTLAWATEALQKGLISLVDTDGLAFNWGEADIYIEAICNVL
jgi:aldehyde:ferredoxin oxidoreductase